MRLRTRILAPVALLAAVAAALAAIALWQQGRVSAVVEQLSQQSHLALEASEARAVSRALQRDALNAIFEPEAGRASILERFDRRVAEFRQHADELERRLAGADAERMRAFGGLQRRPGGGARRGGQGRSRGGPCGIHQGGA
jgi:methyl-accepting chemotaxis protein